MLLYSIIFLLYAPSKTFLAVVKDQLISPISNTRITLVVLVAYPSSALKCSRLPERQALAEDLLAAMANVLYSHCHYTRVLYSNTSTGLMEDMSLF